MPTKPRILAFAGSTRSDSLNKKLVRVAATGAAAAGADVTVIDLRDYPLALYDGDDETRAGLTEHAKKLKQLFLNHDGLLIASPEYNGGMSAVLKNAIDWVSRPASSDEPGLACFRGKVAVIMSASPGGVGGIRGLAQLRSVLSHIQILVLPEQIALPLAHEAFNAEGTLKEAKRQAAVENLGSTLSKTLAKLTSQV